MNVTDPLLNPSVTHENLLTVWVAGCGFAPAFDSNLPCCSCDDLSRNEDKPKYARGACSMALKAYLSVERDVLLPAVLGLIVVAITVVTLYVLRKKKIAGSGQGGTEYVTSLDGQTVRRSTRRAGILARGKYGCFGLYANFSNRLLLGDTDGRLQVTKVSCKVEPR